jgi:hypothetical protein
MNEEHIAIPGDNDVLCGRGGSINSHKGNQQFHHLVAMRNRAYVTANSRAKKTQIAKTIVTDIRSMIPPGRFLASTKKHGGGEWHDIGDGTARKKASQALREQAPLIRLEMGTEIHNWQYQERHWDARLLVMNEQSQYIASTQQRSNHPARNNRFVSPSSTSIMQNSRTAPMSRNSAPPPQQQQQQQHQVQYHQYMDPLPGKQNGPEKRQRTSFGCNGGLPYSSATGYPLVQAASASKHAAQPSTFNDTTGRPNFCHPDP